MDDNWEKFDTIPNNEERIKWVQAWLRNQSRWSNSDFNRTHKVNDLADEWTIPDIEEDHLLELRCESNREDIREWLVDVYVQFGDVGTNKLVKLREIYLKLEVHERVLWDLYYTNMNTMRDISKKLDIPLTAVYKMITDLNLKIKERYV